MVAKYPVTTMPTVLGYSAYRLLQWTWAGLDWLFPPVCVGCDHPGVYLCDDCLQTIQYVLPPICECCGQAIDYPGMCAACRADPPGYTSLRSWAWHTGVVRNAIHRLKYQGDLSLGEVFSRPIINLLNETHWEIDLVVPVPAGIARQAERGYNQAALLAWPVAYACNLAYQAKALYKVRETLSQVGLNRTQRRQNVKQAYRANVDLVSGKKVLIIDDVATSGATMDACTVALLESGATQVYGLTLARAMFADKNDILYQEVQYDSAS